MLKALFIIVPLVAGFLVYNCYPEGRVLNLVEYPKVGEKIDGLSSGIWIIKTVYISDKIIKIQRTITDQEVKTIHNEGMLLIDVINFNQILLYKSHDKYTWYKSPDA